MTQFAFPPTDEQAQIITAVALASQSLMVQSYAGCTKSTTLEMSAPGVQGPALSLAFNKKIADELRPKMPDNFKTQTINSLGHGAWLRAIDRNATLDGNKLGKLVTAVAQARKLPLMTHQWEATRETAKAAMMAGLSPRNMGQPMLLDTPENWADLASEFVLDADEIELTVELAYEVLKSSIDLAKAGQMSFDDQIYCPTILGGSWPRYRVVFVDEAQDLSPLNHRMLGIVCTDILVAVGDSRQAIYAFRGADSNSMENLRALRSQWHDLSLTQTFRCPKAVVARQQGHAPGYRAAPTNADGLFEELEYSDEMQRGWNWQDVKDRLYNIPGATSTAILCRNNAPLVSMAFKLIRAGVGCQMLGRDIGSGLVALTNKIDKDDSKPIAAFVDKLSKWLDKEVAISIANDKQQRAERLQDQAECLYATIDGSSPDTAGELRSVLKRIFSRDSGQVVLSSVHRAKGLEWPLVTHLDPWRIPSIQAKQAAANGDPSQLVQENNLRYVAETRTKHTLLNASIEDFEG